MITSIMLLLVFFACSKRPETDLVVKKVRGLHDTIGFAQYNWQMDSLYKRFKIENKQNGLHWKAAICPHDDYKYAGELYYKALEGINANTIILIGVAHKARIFNLQDKLVFGDFTHWKSPYGELLVSKLNTELMHLLPDNDFMVHDSMQALEHSLEAIIPFIYKKNSNLEIVPILVPYIDYNDLDSISTDLSNAIFKIIKKHNLSYGQDIAIIISNDAVHYGDVDWGGENMAPYGTDSISTANAREHDQSLIENYLIGNINSEKIKSFLYETTYENDYKKYKWVWCGRYSVPFGLATANKLNILINKKPLTGTLLGYASSIDHELVEVEDISMGTTAIATSRHWVAYTSIRYE